MTLSMVMFLSMAFAAGLVLGALYFIALWQTVRRLTTTASPAHLILLSFILRMAVLLAGLYFVMGGHWERLAAAMVGFVLMRKILTYYLGPQEAVESAIHNSSAA